MPMSTMTMTTNHGEIVFEMLSTSFVIRLMMILLMRCSSSLPFSRAAFILAAISICVLNEAGRPPTDHPRFRQLERLGDLPDWIAAIG